MKSKLIPALQEMELKLVPPQTGNGTMTMYTNYIFLSVGSWPAERKDKQLLWNSKLPVFHIFWELNIVQSVSSILLVKSCKIASLSYASRTKYCTVYYILNSVFVSSLQNQFFNDSISYLEQEMDFQLGSILLVKTCKIATLSYAFRAQHCTV